MPAVTWLVGLLLFHLCLGGVSLQDSNDELLAQLQAAGAALHVGVLLEAGGDDRVLRATADLNEGEIIAVLPEQVLLYEQRVLSDPLIKRILETARCVFKPSQAANVLHPTQQAGLTC
jgi:hypothetical protein